MHKPCFLVKSRYKTVYTSMLVLKRPLLVRTTNFQGDVFLLSKKMDFMVDYKYIFEINMEQWNE